MSLNLWISPARRASIVLFVLFVLFALGQSAWCVSNTVVISQVYGAGGNSGSTLNQDYVELFNLGTTPVSLNGWSLQYRSSAGTGSFTAAALPNVTLQPGEYYLVGASTPGTGAAIGADYSLSPVLSLSGTAGQVALSSSTVALTGCPTSDPAIVDFVGYGTAATCSEGLDPTATLAATTAAFRTKVCVDTDDNGNDFSVATAAPRNSSTTFTPCGGAVQSFGLSSVSASPSAVSVGSTTLLTARVTAAVSPASTGVAVTVDLSGVGGSSTQPLYDDGTHGDTAAGDNVFNYSATVAGNPTGTVKLNFKATDAQAHSATASTTLTIQAVAGLVPIHTIQAGAPSSSYLGQMVTTTGIVTAIGTGGFYLEARDVDQDADPTTSEGIFVVSGTSPSVVVGNMLNVTGKVQLSSAGVSGGATLSATEIGGTVTVTVAGTGMALPTPVAITVAADSPTGGFAQFLRYQSMRFTVPNFVTTAPTGGTLAEASETVTSNGEFYGVVSGVVRPFVEPGISVLETSLPTGPTYCTATVTTNCVMRFDGNPELMLIESTGLGGAALDVTSNQTITNLLGIVDFTTGKTEFLLDKTAPGVLGAPMTYIPVPVALANEFTVGSMNIERFYSNVPATGAVTLTTEAYTRRLKKVSLLLRNVQRMPDIIGMQEVGTLQTLMDISTQISTDAVAAGQADPMYSACLIQGNDSSGINTAFLVKTTRVTVTDCTQFGKSTMFTNSTGAQAVLNDRPPLVLRAVVNIPGYAAFPVTVISNHLKALTGVDDTTSTGATVRLKKEAQDEFLAALIQTYQVTGDHVISVGDYNSFEFNDGYVDNLGVIKGTPAAAATVVTSTSSTYVAPNPVLTDLESTIVDPLQRYDYSYIGNAQTLDHIVVSQNVLGGAHIAFSHEDADFPLIQYNDATTPQSTSDHDGAVGFFPLLLTGQTSTATLTPAAQNFGSVVVGSTSAGVVFTFANTGNTALTIGGIATTGDFAKAGTTCGSSVAVGASCTVTVTFTPTVSGARSGTLTVANSSVSNTTLMSVLTGSGAPANASVTLTPASAAFGTVTLGNSSGGQVFTFSNTGNVVVTIASVTVTGDFAKTTTCGTTLAPGTSCTANVTFAPTAAGARTGTLTVASSGSTAGLVSSLSGTGGAQATLTPGSATFASTGVGSSATAQVFTVTNTAGAGLTFTAGSIAVTGDYTQTNTCGTALAAGASCAVSVVFTPAAAGTRTGTLTVTPTLGTFSTMLTATLTGTATVPLDFLFTPSNQAGTIAAGQLISTTLTLTAQSGYTGTIKVACTGAPAGSTCTVSPGSVALGAKPLNISLLIATTKTASGMVPTGGMSGWLIGLGSVLGCLALVTKRRKLLRGAVMMAGLLMLGLAVSGCGTTGSTSATPSGSYVYTLTATDGTLTHSATYTLTLQ